MRVVMLEALLHDLSVISQAGSLQSPIRVRVRVRVRVRLSVISQAGSLQSPESYTGLLDGGCYWGY